MKAPTALAGLLLSAYKKNIIDKGFDSEENRANLIHLIKKLKIMTTKNNPPSTGQCPSCGSFCNTEKDIDGMDYCNDCRPSTPANKLIEELDKFSNGQMRYEEDSTFKHALDSLVAGVRRPRRHPSPSEPPRERNTNP